MIAPITRQLSRLILTSANKNPEIISHLQRLHTSLFQLSQTSQCSLNEENRRSLSLDYETYLKIVKPGVSCGKETIVQLLHLSNNIVNNIAKQHPRLKEIPPKDLLENYQTLINDGMEKSLIKDNIYAVIMPHVEFQKKMEIIRSYGLDINNAICFFKLTPRQLKIFRKFCNMEKIKPVEKVEGFCKLLQQDPSIICDFLVKYPPMRTLSLISLEQKIKLLLENGFHPDVILSDGMTLSIGLNRIQANLQLITRYNVTNKKMWMLRCTEAQLKNHMEYQCHLNKLDGQYVYLDEYISQRLNRDLRDAHYLINKNRNISKMSINKVKCIFDLLDKYGITSNQILSGSQLFSRSLNTLNNRLSRVLSKYGRFPARLHFLHMNHKRFDEFINNDSLEEC